jgi:hypothetical protein
MMKIAGSFFFALTLIVLSSFTTKGAISPMAIEKNLHLQVASHHIASATENIEFYDLFEDEVDESFSESERKKTGSGKSVFYAAANFPAAVAINYLNGRQAETLLCALQLARYIFLGVLRL